MNPSVCLFIPQLAVGGSERQVFLLATGLQAEGFAPAIATLTLHDGVGDRFAAAGLPPVVLPRRLPGGLDTIAALAGWVRRERASVLHAWLYAANWRAALVRLRVPRLPVVVSVRSMENDLGPVHDLLYRLTTPLTDAVVVNSPALAAHHSARTGTPESKYRVVPNGVETADLDRDDGAVPGELAGIPPGAPIVGYVGRLAPRKRVETLARIAPEVLRAHPEARFVVVGDGASRASIVAASVAAGVAHRFVMAGAQSRVGPYLRRMHVFVNPGYGEGASNAILEAMALGVPVVAYAEAGNVDTVRDGVTGWLVRDGDEAALAQRVIGALSDGPAARAIGDAARAHVRTELSVPVMVRRMADVYRGVIDARSAR